MKLERLQEYVLPFVATLCGMGFAVYVGQLMGQGQTGKVMMMLGILFLGFLTMVMRQYIWLLLIVTWPWPGSMPILPASLSPRDVGIAAVFAAFLALKALKVARRRPQYELVDLVMIGLIAYMVTVFVRNPVGTLLTQSDRVGGRPYFNIAMSCAAYFVLARASFPVANGAKILIFSMLASNYALGLLNMLADLSPRFARFILGFYTGISVAEEMGATPVTSKAPDERIERLSYTGYLGSPTVLALVSFFRPLTLITPIYIWRFLLLLLSLYLIMLSGFRSVMLAAAGYFAIATYLRAGWADVVRVGIMGFFALALLLLGQGRIFDLPLSAQRSLTFLPGLWSQNAKDSAASSSEWRYEMWRVLLQGNKYVHSEWFGDGFGISKRDMQAIAFLQGRGGGAEAIETTLILGTVHSGPLSTIRFAGYVGLAIYMTLIILIARYAWRLARRAQGTPFFPLTLFVGLPLIYEPVNFVFIFGGFDSGFPATIYHLGMLKMVSNTVSDYLDRPAEAAPASPRRIADAEYALTGSAR